MQAACGRARPAADLPAHEDVPASSVVERAAGEAHVVAVVAEGGKLAPVVSIGFLVRILMMYVCMRMYESMHVCAYICTYAGMDG